MVRCRNGAELSGTRPQPYIRVMAPLSDPTSVNSARPNVLLTGFGPFPGVPVNVSGALAEALRDAAEARFPKHAFHSAVLATEWRQAPTEVARLYDALSPVLALHFGVTRTTPAVRLERLAQNTCRASADAAGLMPIENILVADGAARHAARLPLDAIYQRLAARAVPVTFSDDAGGYLCNAVLYHALSHGRVQEGRTLAGFIHLPHDLESPPLSFSGAVDACLEIIDVALTETIGSAG